jgi:hypothetical protein
VVVVVGGQFSCCSTADSDFMIPFVSVDDGLVVFPFSITTDGK